MMRPGDRWMLYIPASLGYGASGSGRKIPGGATLIFDLELFSFEAGPFSRLGLPLLDYELFGPITLWMVLLGMAAATGVRYVLGLSPFEKNSRKRRQH
jgi:hypothetical protein